MINQIEEKIKKLYGTKASFCEEQEYAYKDFAGKLKTVRSKINWVNKFIKPLGLEISFKPVKK